MPRDTTLLVVAAPAEARAVLKGLGADPRAGAAELQWVPQRPAPGFDLVVCGIGKANAAGATARFHDASRHGRVLSIGIAGALPHRSTAGDDQSAALGSVICATHCVFADEGLRENGRFLDCAQMGFPLTGPSADAFSGNNAGVSSGVLAELRPLADSIGPIATVSTCSGTDDLAREVAHRTGALAEAMEGAAVALAAVRLGVPFGELRVISNTTGDRAGQKWDLKGALARLEAVIGRLRG